MYRKISLIRLPINRKSW